MMKINFFLFITLFLLISCSQGQNPYVTNYFTGTKGLELEFVGDSPPNEVYENTEFPLAVFVSNEGAFSLNGSPFKGKLSYSYDSFYLSPLMSTSEEDNSREIILEGKSNLYPKGDLQPFILPNFLVKPVVGQREMPITDFFVSACYPYNTKLTDEICIDTSSVTADVRQQTCKSEDKVYDGQGAPVAVTLVKTEIQPFGNTIRPAFLISIENKGAGSVLAPVDYRFPAQTGAACDLQPDMRKDWNKVIIKATVSGEELKCVPEEITLRGEKGFARCYSESPEYAASLNYYAILIVELDYVYMTSISKKINIIRSGLPETSPVLIGGCESYGTGWSCSCTADDCVTQIGQNFWNKKLKEITNDINVKSGNCVFNFGLCEKNSEGERQYCCLKQ